jgi:AcrR family transcriptional regulator
MAIVKTSSPLTPPATAHELLSKREQNRANTRLAILKAARRLLMERGYGNFTANEVAELAGCSRRTFFNYFPTLPAAILEPTMSLPADIHRIVLEQPEGAHLFEVLQSLGTVFQQSAPGTLDAIVHMHALAAHNPEVERYSLQGWADFEESLMDALEIRFPATEHVVLRAIVAAVSASSRAGYDKITAAYRVDKSTDLNTLLATSIQEMLVVFFQGFAAYFPQETGSTTQHAAPAASPSTGE